MGTAKNVKGEDDEKRGKSDMTITVLTDLRDGTSFQSE